MTPTICIGYGTFEVFVYDFEVMTYQKEGSEKHINIAHTSVGDIMVNDQVAATLAAGKDSVFKAISGSGKASPAVLSASMYQNKDTKDNRWSLNLPSTSPRG